MTIGELIKLADEQEEKIYLFELDKRVEILIRGRNKFSNMITIKNRKIIEQKEEFDKLNITYEEYREHLKIQMFKLIENKNLENKEINILTVTKNKKKAAVLLLLQIVKDKLCI
ncbi:hypothetical protein [Cetobacterium sp.]|uniref:hypothetical protein n=1 Tax=Cetobacterium sp. TaxID=2071632 RepID=UPI003F2A4747